jgi:hypothetical protein
MDTIARIKELEKERMQLAEQGKKEALERARTAVDDLKALGFDYALVDSRKRGKRTATKRRGHAGQLKDAPCPVCRFQTSPLHDARKHRSQGRNKKPFTQAELQSHGLERV